ADLGETLREGLDEVKRCRADRGKITHICIVWSLPEGHIVNELWDEPIQVHIALSMGMSGEIDRDAIHKTGEIRTMIQIKTAQKILVGFAAATVLRHDYARHDLQNLSWAEQRPGFELLLTNPTFRRRLGNAREIICPTRYYNRLQGLGGARRRLLLSCWGRSLGLQRHKSIGA